TQLTVEASVFGTPAYMAPEQALDSKNVDARADIYSLGIVFFEMVTGQKPYKSGTMVEILTQVASRDDIQDSKFLNPNIPDDIAELIKDMTRKDRDKRVKSTGELLKRLARINTKNLEQQDQQSTQLTNDLTPVAASSQETALTIDQIPAGDGLETALTIDQIPSADSQDRAITIDAIQQPHSATDSEPKQQSTQKTQVPESVQPRKSKARLLIGILAAFLVFLIIIVIARSVSGGKESPKTEQVTQTEEQTEKTEQTTEATETITPTVVEKVTETAPETEKKTPDQPSPSPDQVKTDVAEQDKQEAVVEKPTKSEPEVKPPPETTQADKEEPKKTEPEEESFVSKEIPASSIVILDMNSSKHATIKQALAKKSGKSVALLEAATFSAYRKQLEDIIAKKPALVVLMHSTQCAQQKMTKSGFSNRITNEANLLQSSGIPFLFVQDFGAGNPAVLSQFNNLIREHCAVNSSNMVDSRFLHQDELIDEIMLNLADE
ncbi:MAG: protein kinase, partial [Chloroflexi bacterium]|nr:protein kinase [Chloroflexota bacterium]